jgi:predicted alpha-1,6-mannanase (GH76 family)
MPPYGNGGDFFYDDNEWVGLFDVQRFLMTGDRTALTRAEQIFELVKSGWDTDASHAAPGGVFWTQATWSHDRNTVSNMPGAELGLRLYQLTRQPSYLDWSRRMYDWTNAPARPGQPLLSETPAPDCSRSTRTARPRRSSRPR